jgi:uncharacterized protein YcaQ
VPGPSLENWQGLLKKTHLSLELARRAILNGQLLDGQTELPAGKEGVAQTVEKLGYVQIDTIAAIQRAHHHTLWTRRPDYDPGALHELQARDRRVFEYWGHAVSYLPTCDYRYYLPRMRSFDDPYSKWERGRREKYGHLMQPVLERIRQEGPLSSRDFSPPPGTERSTPPGTKRSAQGRDPHKSALELLHLKGDLMVTERRNFQRVYDLTERVLPEGTDTSLPTDDELGQFLVRRALSAHGVAREKAIREHIDAASKETISKALGDLIETAQVIPLKIEDQRATYYTLPETIEKSARLQSTPPRVHLLSPFDNLIIQRERTRRLFGFDYALECYVPAARRKYGYFVLPILWGENLVGRLDPKAERKKKTLILRNLVFEPGFKAGGDFLSSFAGKLWDFARFNRCEKVALEKISPADLKPTLEHFFEEHEP